MDTIKCINREYATQSTSTLEYFVECMIRNELTKMDLNIYQPHIITKITQGFNEELESLMTFNTPATPHNGIVHNQEADKQILNDIQKRYRSGVGLLL